jgi:transcriptional regulator with XRE-family HTH domain
VELSAETLNCVECGRELPDLGSDEASAARCEDCQSETGPRSPFAAQLATNLLRLRERAGLSTSEFGRRAGLTVDRVAKLEREGQDLRLTTLVRLLHPLGASIDQFTERIFWNPGQVTYKTPNAPRERLTGFFLALPANVPVFESKPRQVTPSRRDATSIVGANIRSTRERRHLSQEALGLMAGLSKSGLSLIERGVRETSIQALFALARSLEVPAEFLLDGVDWKPEGGTSRESRARRRGGSLDDAICRLWNEDKTAREIAEVLKTSPGTVSAMVHRLRERGAGIRYRRRPTRAVHERARQRRLPWQTASCQQADLGAAAPEPARIVPASHQEIATRIGENVAAARAAAGTTYRELQRAAEMDFSYAARVEHGRSGVPRLAVILKLAGSLNVRPSFITAGLAWDAASESVVVQEVIGETQTAPRRLGENARQARYRLDLSQQALSDRAAMSRGDLVDFESGSRNFRIFTVVRIAGALEVGFDELFAGVANWHIRPLAPPEFLPGEAPTKAERDELLIRLWSQGRGEQEIAEALDLSRASIGPYVRELRDSGVQLEYRRPPRSRSELLARRRRRGDGHEPPQLRRR